MHGPSGTNQGKRIVRTSLRIVDLLQKPKPSREATHRDKPAEVRRSDFSTDHRSRRDRQHKDSHNNGPTHAEDAGEPHNEQVSNKRHRSSRSTAEQRGRSKSPNSPAADRWQMY